MKSRPSRRGACAGLSLIELLVAAAVMGMIASAGVALVSAGLQSHQEGLAGSRLHQEAMQIMDRITDSVRRATWVRVPNAHARTRELLVVSGFTNDDNDFYFGDPLFPRIDEDPKDDMNRDGKSGVSEVDDDGDGRIDEEGDHDDDEDGQDHEDILDGKDNDGDGNIDEDLDNDANHDGRPGIAGMDDDGDGVVDEGESDDDDEDGTKDEDPLNSRIYWTPGGGVLREDDGQQANRVLSENVSLFRVTFVAPQLFEVELTLTDSAGRKVVLTEAVCARNVLQNTGKRVR